MSVSPLTTENSSPVTLVPSSRRAPAPHASPDASTRNSLILGTPMPFLHPDNQPKPRFHWNTNQKPLFDQSGPRAVDSSSNPATVHTRTTVSYTLAGASGTGVPEDADSTHSAGVTSPPLSDSDQPKSNPPAPNIYINGLPPHFSEQELFALARQFGEVKSVRTFTRHVSEKPTGYGFVLFNDIGSAEKCIEGLRKYRNLHPSFSKQIHRIPGTIYAQQSIAQPPEQDPASFKARMEKLKDEHSTNLYIEGLPLSIDDESLTTLVAPHRIKSSRFFKTKLSDPPRIIAFVRLESRTAAEETIERLHGQMVRGWNDPGCRISVRFADSAEQRELRRTERMLKGEDQSSSRLTIAQAALLNLRGQDLQTGTHKASRPFQHEDVPQLIGRRGTAQQSLRQCQASLDYLPGPRSLSASTSLPANLARGQYTSPIQPVRDLRTSPDMDALMQSIKNVGIEDGGLFDSILGDYHAVPQTSFQTLANARSLSGAAPMARTQTHGQTQARNGFTPTEEMILQTHARRLQLQAQISNGPHAFEQDILRADSSAPPVGGPSFNTRNQVPPPNGQGRLPAASSQFQLGRLRTAKSSPEFLPTISEDDSHGVGEPWNETRSSHVTLQSALRGCLPMGSSSTAGLKLTRPTTRGIATAPLLCPDEQVGNAREYQQSGTAIGADRLPPVRSSQTSVPCVRLPVISRPSPSSLADIQPYHLSATSASNTAVASSGSIRSENSQDSARTPRVSVDVNVNGGDGDLRHTSFGSCSRLAVHTGAGMSPHPEDPPMSTSTPTSTNTVVSPALTCSSRTPSTLSPATPFVGSFGCAHDAFEVVTAGGVDCHEDGIEKEFKVVAQSK